MLYVWMCISSFVLHLFRGVESVSMIMSAAAAAVKAKRERKQSEARRDDGGVW